MDSMLFSRLTIGKIREIKTDQYMVDDRRGLPLSAKIPGLAALGVEQMG